MTSTNYKVRVSVVDNGGDSTSSASFQMLGSVGQASIDTMNTDSYISKNGFIYNLLFTSDSLAVTAPNGGENWEVGTSHNITWTTTGSVPNVKLEYSTNGGVTFPHIIATASNIGSYAWTIPDSIANGVRVRVSDSDVPSAFDVSDADFGIRGAFTLTRPNGGDSFQAGAAETITWSGTGTITAVKLEYSIDSGISWAVIETSTANAGSYIWTVPNIGTTQGKIRVSHASDSTTNDTSDDVFSINADTLVTVSLAMPSDGFETSATAIQFQWLTSNDAETYTWQLSRTASFTTIADSVADTTATIIVRTLTANDSYYWRVIGQDRVGNYDTTTERGFIVDTLTGKVVLTSPSSGSVTVDSTPTLSWTALSDSVGIDSYVLDVSNSPAFSSTVFTDTVDGVKTSDTVLTELGVDTYYWRVRAIDNLQNVGTYSDSFTILIDTVHTLTVTAPNGGQVWLVGETQTITWTATGTMANVRLELSTDSGVTFPAIIAASTTNTGSYAWNVPDSIGATIRLKISNASDTTTTDSSDANITIRGGFTITQPNGGDSIQAGTAESVTWTSTGTIATVRLEYSVDSGSSWSLITASTANNGSHLWSVPNVNTTQAKVRVLSVSDTTTNDTSDDIFRINPITVPPPPDTIMVSAGNHQLGAPSSALSLTVRVVDTGGSSGVLGAKITFTVTNGYAGLSSATVYTDATGYATDTITLGTAAGVYRVEARNDSVTPAKSVVFTAYADGRDIPAGGNTVGQGWRMVGPNKCPVGWDLNSATGGLPNATVYEWRPDQPDVSGLNSTKYYEPSGDAVRGRAYWVKDASGGRVFVPSDGYATADTVQVRLNVGWNQVTSGQYFYVSWDSGVAFDTSGVNDTALPENQRLTPYMADQSNVIQNKMYWYTGSNYVYGPANETYTLTSMQLKPMVGFWLYAEKSCTMFIYPNPVSPETHATEILNQAPAYLSAGYNPQAHENDWAIQLVASAGGVTDWQNYVGVKSTSQKRHAASALEPPGVAAGYVTLAVREKAGPWMAASYGEPITTGRTWDVFVSTDMGQAMLTWDNIQNLPTTYEAYLVGGVSPVNLRTASSTIVTPSPMTLVVGVSDFLAPFLASPLSKEQTFAYPNPASDNVTFKYNLQTAGDVSIRIFDVGGRLVRELKASSTVGPNTLTWDTTNKNGQKVGSGVYIYRIESGGNKMVDKLAVVR